MPYRKTLRQPAKTDRSLLLSSRSGADGVMEWTLNFKSDQAIRISDGPFANLIGKLEHLDSAGRVRVLLDLLGRSVSDALRCECLIAAA